MADETMVQKKERRHHNPDDIIDGKPKWSNVVIVRDMIGSNNRILNVDRLDPSWAEIEELDENYGDDADKQQRVVMQMMSELMVTLGNSRLDPKVEEQMMQKNLEWEC